MGVADVYAHVWEENEEARRWYKGRGFWEEGGRVEGYYRKLKPSGAVIVRREVGRGCD
jgi:ribosomal protein S18 acetylase RimI-like enzyme